MFLKANAASILDLSTYIFYSADILLNLDKFEEVGYNITLKQPDRIKKVSRSIRKLVKNLNL